MKARSKPRVKWSGFLFKGYAFTENAYLIMANVKLLFYGTEESETENVSIECFYNVGRELSIVIDEEKLQRKKFIVLDKSTAIRFSKELRKQIALMD